MDSILMTILNRSEKIASGGIFAQNILVSSTQGRLLKVNLMGQIRSCQGRNNVLPEESCF